MWSSAEVEKQGYKKASKRLSREILGLFGATALIAIFCFWAMNEVANIIVLNYVEEEMLDITEYQLIDLQYWILGVSFASAIILFIVLFLFLVGERLAYISEIVKGIDALGRHEWHYEIPLHGENELTELAQRINELSKEEEAFQEKEKQLQLEKESLIRSLSHDIRTPLTSILSYSEYMKKKEALTTDEIKDYMELMEQKAGQIKVLTDRLLDGGSRHPEQIDNGRFLMEQLVDEWAAELENDFTLNVSLEECPVFSGEFDVQELCRVFDNLSSNIRKYADENLPVILKLCEKDGRVCVFQSNKCKKLCESVESTKIGIDSIRKIAAYYGGGVEVFRNKGEFSIKITLVKIKK